MEIVEQKFGNFVNFIRENIKNSTYASLLGTVNVNTFLAGLKPHENKIAKEVTLIVCDKFNIKKEDYSSEVIAKFERYIDYFLQVVRTMK